MYDQQLIDAVLDGDVLQVTLYAAKANVNICVIDEPLLVTAMRHNNPTLVKLLLDNGADPNFTYKNGNTPLLAAVKQRSTEMAKLLIGAGADVNYQNQHGDNPLLLALTELDEPMIELLLAHGADVNTKIITYDMTIMEYFQNIAYLIQKGSILEKDQAERIQAMLMAHAT